MPGGSENWRTFALAFSITFLVFSLLAVGVVFWLNPMQAPAVDPNTQRKGTGYLPSAQEDLTLLVAGIADGETQPGTFLLVGFRPAQGKVPVLALPAQTLVEWGETKLTLAQVYAQEGPLAAKEALGGTLGIGVDRYAAVHRSGFLTAAGMLGPVEYELPYAVTLEEAGGRITIQAGRQLVDGKRAAALMAYQGYPGGELTRLQVVSQLAGAVIDQRMDVAISTAAERIFRQTVNLLETDITFWDYEERLQAVQFLCRLQVRTATEVPVLGRFSPDGSLFLPEEQTLELVRQLYGSQTPTAKARD